MKVFASTSLLFLLVLSMMPGSVAGQEQEATCEPEKSKVPRGLVFRAALGPAVWTGQVGDASRVGFGFTFGTGYEFFSWLALEAAWSSGFHQTNQPFPPASGNFSTHAAHVGARFSLPLDPLDLFLRGGAGWTWSHPDILVRIEGFDTEPRFSWMAGAGLTWHTPRRNIWIGIECKVVGVIDFPGMWVLSGAVIGVTL